MDGTVREVDDRRRPQSVLDIDGGLVPLDGTGIPYAATDRCANGDAMHCCLDAAAIGDGTAKVPAGNVDAATTSGENTAAVVDVAVEGFVFLYRDSIISRIDRTQVDDTAVEIVAANERDSINFGSNRAGVGNAAAEAVGANERNPTSLCGDRARVGNAAVEIVARIERYTAIAISTSNATAQATSTGTDQRSQAL